MHNRCVNCLATFRSQPRSHGLERPAAVTLACTSAMSGLWLSSGYPRCAADAGFTNSHENLRQCFSDPEILRIRSGDFYCANPCGYHVEALFDEVCYPMCSPEFHTAFPPGQRGRFTEQHADSGHRNVSGPAGGMVCLAGYSGHVSPRRTWVPKLPFYGCSQRVWDGILRAGKGWCRITSTAGTGRRASRKLTAAGKCYMLTPQDRFLNQWCIR